MINPFFKNTGPHSIKFLLNAIDLKNENLHDDKITDIKDLNSSKLPLKAAFLNCDALTSLPLAAGITNPCT